MLETADISIPTEHRAVLGLGRRYVPGVDEGRADCVHPDPFWAQLTVHTARHLKNGGLGRVVRRPCMPLITRV